MKNRKNIIATVFALVLAASIIAASAATASANNRKNTPTETLPEIVSVNSPDDCGVPSIGSFVKDMNSLTEKEREALLGDLAEIAKLEKQIDEIYARMTDKNAEKLYKEISAIDDKITAVLERNSKLWERVNDEYDEQIAANETDMTLELNEADLNDAREDEYAYEKFVRNLDTITEDERAALIADLAKVAELNEKIDAIYARMTDKNADKLYEEIDAVEAEITEKLQALGPRQRRIRRESRSERSRHGLLSRANITPCEKAQQTSHEHRAVSERHGSAATTEAL